MCTEEEENARIFRIKEEIDTVDDAREEENTVMEESQIDLDLEIIRNSE